MKTILKYAVLCFSLLLGQAAAAAGLFFDVTLSGSTLNIKTTIPYHTYPGAGIKINSAGFSLTNAGSECTMAGNGYCLFSVSNATTKTISITGSSGTLNVTLCLNGNGPLSCQNYNVVFGSSSSMAYVANGSNVQSCPVNTDGTFGSCSASQTFNGATGVALDTVANRAYVTENGSNQVSVCPIIAGGGFDICFDSTGVGFDGPDGVAINSAGTFAYVSNVTSGKVRACQINSDGTFGTCASNSIGSGIPFGLTLNNAGDRIYIATQDSLGVVQVCLASGTTVFCGGMPIGNTFNLPVGVALNPLNTILYVVNNGSDTVSVCPLSGGGALGTCIDSGQLFVTGPQGIAINAAGTKAYISYNTTSVSECTINPTDGTFSSCVNASTAFSNALYLALN